MFKSKFRNIIIGVLFCSIAARFALMGLLEVFDTTEARYAGMAIRMLQNKDFITSYIYDNVPFLAKPPMTFWLMTLSYKLFGISELSARFPIFLLGMGLLAFIYHTIRRVYNNNFAISLVVIFFTSPIVNVMLGYSTIDSVLVSFVSMAMLSGWRQLKTPNKQWSYLFFIFSGLAILTKGLFAMFLILAPLGIYLTITKKWRIFFSTFNVFYGSILSATIFLPWYLLEEISHPGFLKYFIIGEHFSRFLVNSWSGDMYGGVQYHTYGTILVYFIIGTIPWALFAVYLFYKNTIKEVLSVVKRSNDDLIYFACYALVPLALFMLTHAITFGYIVFSVLPMAFVLNKLIEKLKFNINIFILASLISLILNILAMCVADLYTTKFSDKEIIQYAVNCGKKDIYYFNKPSFSALFYSRNKTIINIKEIKHKNSNLIDAIPVGNFLAIHTDSLQDIEETINTKRLHKKICRNQADREKCVYEIIQ